MQYLSLCGDTPNLVSGIDNVLLDNSILYQELSDLN